APIAMWLGVIGIFYGAWMAFAQTDIKRLIAYTSVSHMGFVLMALAFFGKGFGALGWPVISDTAPKEIVGLCGGVFNVFGNVA
ncbi:proton-conducting transporter transmembrane domain-containing protein, partial [Escherichia coli]|uniref:proton-conducting transporter transmembrane domain-containing protein n=1 Tax=Escherichia coli TaxID=562 RepID=UPI0025740803